MTQIDPLKLKLARIAARKTTLEAAAAVGKTRAAVNHWERGTHQPGGADVVILASLYGVDGDSLLAERPVAVGTGAA